jgi:putative DNA primase/helicase
MMSQLENVLSRLKKVRRSGKGRVACCPAHDDSGPSLSIDEGDDGRVLLICRSAGCTTESIVAAIGLTMADLFPPTPQRAGAARHVCWYDYTDEKGNLLYQVERKDPKSAGFPQRRPDGHGGWIHNLNGVERVLYRLPEILKAKADGTVIVVTAGEKDVDNLRALGFKATTNSGGEGNWQPSCTETLRGAVVVICPDNDKKGGEHRDKVARALHGTVALLKIIEVPAPHKDISDWIAAGATADEIKQLAHDAPVYEPTAEASTDVDETPAADSVAAEPPAPGDVALDRTETGNAAVFKDLHGQRVRYVPGWKQWIVWQDSHWVADPGNVYITELAKDVGRHLGKAAFEEETAKARTSATAWATKALSANGIKNALELARGIDGIPIGHEELDSDPWLLGVRNGVVELKTGSHRAARPTDMMMMQAPVDFDPNATAPRWTRALEEWFPDAQVRDYVQRLVGAALVGTQQDHIFVIHYGGGRNGKGTFVRALQRVLGPTNAGGYSATPHLSLLVQQKHSEHDTIKADLFRARLAVASETERRVTLAEASIKNLTGGDRIACRRMRQDYWSFNPSHTLWLQTNYLPVIHGRDRGIWSRIRVVKWESTFEQNPDTGLDDTLAGEQRGILAWAVAGCQLWLEQGLAEPDAVVRATLAYRDAEDQFARFAASTGLEFRKGMSIPATILNQLLKEWADAEGVEPSRGEFADWLKDHGAVLRRPRSVDGKNIRIWIGVGALTLSIEGEPSEPMPSRLFSSTASHEELPENGGSLGSVLDREPLLI